MRDSEHCRECTRVEISELTVGRPEVKTIENEVPKGGGKEKRDREYTGLQLRLVSSLTWEPLDGNLVDENAIYIVVNLIYKNRRLQGQESTKHGE
jgi:hypothetical protein